MPDIQLSASVDTLPYATHHMISRFLTPTTRIAALLLATMATASPLLAQPSEFVTDPMTDARAAAARRDPAEALSRYLRVLSARPRDLEALVGAGRAALDIGDPSAAIGFYARAEEIAPREPRVKAGLGSAMVQMENAGAALRLFDDAILLGVEEAEIASDRGLAYDLRGDNRQAQQQYALALRRREDGETRRRLALSVAISGDQAGALAILDPLLRRQDVGAWRVRAFVLALTGDVPGAESAAYAVMPRSQADALAPFLARLPGLRPSQKAAAVHFGHFPSDGRRYSPGELVGQVEPSSRPLASAPGTDRRLIPSGEPLGASPREPQLSGPRRRPGAGDQASAQPGAKSTPAPPKPVLPPVRIAATTPANPPAPFGPPAPPPEDKPSAPVVPAAPAAEAKPAPVVKPVELPASQPAAAAAAAKPVVAETSPKSVPAAKPAPKPKAEPPLKPAAKADEPVKGKEPPKAKPDSKAKEDAKAKDDAKKTDPKEKDGAKNKESAKSKESAKEKSAKAKPAKEPERHWVQIAGGANKADFPKRFAALKEKYPKLLSGRSAWTTPLRATNRLLVGPFKSAAEAQAFVNSSSKEGFSTFAFTSEAGQEIEKLAAK
jgi:Flp pilus assembly protein TadD